MKADLSSSETTSAAADAQPVSLSKWVNEKLPPLNEILSAHEVARLTRRHRWFLTALTLLGRFPRQERFRGRAIGWRKSELEFWLRRTRRARRHAKPSSACTWRAVKCRSRLHKNRRPACTTSFPAVARRKHRMTSPGANDSTQVQRTDSLDRNLHFTFEDWSES